MGLSCDAMSTGGWVTMIGLWAALTALAVWAVCRLFPTQRTSDLRATLDARLASGQIDLDTYHQVIGELGGHTPAATRGRR